jgi:hypothetical protein
MAKDGTTTKEQSLENWKGLPANQNPLQHMEPIAYKATGSKYGACGIRIDGSPEFIDAVLSCLKPLIDGENHATRLELSRSQVKPVEIDGKVKSFQNAHTRNEVCYVRLHMRSKQGQAASAVFDRHLKGATTRYAKAIGTLID